MGSDLRNLAEVDACHECDFEYRLERAPVAGRAIVDAAGQLAELVRRGTSDARSRREPATWSPLEYACHVRDVLLVQRERVLMARRRHRPALEPMGRDERVDHDGYAEQRPDDVARQLGDAAHLFANVLSRLGDEDWERPVVYGYPAPAERSLRWVAVHTLHEVHHHLFDVRRQLA
ncbi:MAG: DinB family protein [Actinomycetota bacterium]|nr:DinB family protein [Actinomycetota bacterium]